MSANVTSQRRAVVSGVKGVAPILLGVIPFGMIYGVLAVGAGLHPVAAQAMSCIVFAGSAQFIAAGLFRVGAPGIVLVLTTLIVNLRHLLYSASVAPYLAHLSWRWKALLAYLLTDEAYAVAIMHYRSLPRGNGEAGRANAHYYFLGAGLGLWGCWQLSTAAGIILGAQIPDGWALDFTLALTFIALVVPVLRDRPSWAAALAAGAVALATVAWPYRLGLMAAALTGIAVGLWLDLRQQGARP